MHQPGLDMGGSHEDGPKPAKRQDGTLTKIEREQRLEKIQDWWLITREAHADNRLEMRSDADFYDHIQWTEEDMQILRSRNQAPLVYNKIKIAIDWIIGSERRSRVDHKVLPRTEEDLQEANIKQSLLKYISDTSRTPFERSKAFEDAAKVGVGWMEEGLRGDEDEEPIFQRHLAWANIWWDAQSRRLDMDDCRFMFRSLWLDLDIAVELFPKHARALVEQATQNIFPNSETPDEDFDLPALFQQVDSYGRSRYRTTYSGIVDAPRKARRRVRVIECWHKVPKGSQRIWSSDSFGGETYDEKNEHMVDEVQNGLATLTDAITLQMEVCIFIPGTLLYHKERPYAHNRFPFTPIWCFRRDRDGMPYGFIRGAKDAQMDLNKRMSKALYILSTRQTIYETEAIPDVDEWQAQIANPAGMLEVRSGALSGNRIEIKDNTDIQQGHVQLMQLDADHIMDVSGVTRENMGMETNSQSGVAVEKKQNQGQMTSAGLFDNLRLAVQIGGEKTLSLAEQFIIKERQIRITGEGPDGGMSFLKLNQPMFDEQLGRWVWENDISRAHADFVVDQQDFRESMRMALGEKLLELVGQLPPEIGLNLLDLVVEMIDLPQRDEIVRRIRSLTGVKDPNANPDSPEAQMQLQAEAEASDKEARQEALEEGAAQAEIRSKAATAAQREGQAAKSMADAELTLRDVQAADRFLQDGGSAAEYIHEE